MECVVHRVMNKTVAELAALVDGLVEGDPSLSVSGVASVDDAGDGDIVLAADARFFMRAVESKAVCMLADNKESAACNGKTVIRVNKPAEAFVKILNHFNGEELLPGVGIGANAVVEPDVELGEAVAIGANCYIGRNAKLGDGCILFPNVYIGDGVDVGEKTKIYPGAVIYPKCKIGKRVILHAGVVIGADGFGYIPSDRGLVKFPHTGTVTIGDDVEIGANSTIDRAKTGVTIVGNGTKIDNLVHIAHNVKIGSNCIIVALSGLAGSVEIGNGVTLAAQTGVKDHVRIGDGSVVAARAGVIGNIPKGSVVSGFPARDHCTERRVQAARLHLPEILQRLRALETELAELREKAKSDNDGDA